MGNGEFQLPGTRGGARQGRRLSRRELLSGGARLSAGAGAAWLLAACGTGNDSGSPAPSGSGSAAANLSGTAVLTTYPGWMGKNEISSFEDANPGASVKMTGSSSGATG